MIFDTLLCHPCNVSLFDIFCINPSTTFHILTSQCPLSTMSHFLMSSAIFPSATSHFLTSPLQLCHFTVQSFFPQHHHFSSQCSHQQHLPALSPHAMIPFYGVTSPNSMLLFYGMTFPNISSSQQVIAYHPLPSSHAQNNVIGIVHVE